MKFENYFMNIIRLKVGDIFRLHGSDQVYRLVDTISSSVNCCVLHGGGYVYLSALTKVHKLKK